MLTLDNLKEMKPDAIIGTGIIKNNPDGVYMTEYRLNEDLRWVAVRGGYHDWTIYISWAENPIGYIFRSGDKVSGKESIKKLVPCDEEAFQMYRR